MNLEFITMADFEIADPKSVFRGLTYGQWVAVWYNNLMSDKPDIVYREGKNMVFLRGNVEFSYEKQEEPKNRAFSSMTKEQRIKIQEDTAVFVPVISTMFALGDDYQGQVLNDELSMRLAARRDTVNGGEIGVQIRKKPENNGKKLVDDLNNYYIETPLFPASVSEKSLIRYTIESPIEPGQYQALVVGVFVIISTLSVGMYRLSFYGRGVGRYLTRSVYDIEVSKGKGNLVDVSDPGGEGILPEQQQVMDFVAGWKEKNSTKET
jgi:hypothetical protein